MISFWQDLHIFICTPFAHIKQKNVELLVCPGIINSKGPLRLDQGTNLDRNPRGLESKTVASQFSHTQLILRALAPRGSSIAKHNIRDAELQLVISTNTNTNTKHNIGAGKSILIQNRDKFLAGFAHLYLHFFCTH